MQLNKYVLFALAFVAGCIAAQAGQLPETQLKAAVQKSLAVLQPNGPTFVKTSGCVSCHNNTLPLMATAAARSRNIPVDKDNERQQLSSVIGVATPMREALLEATYAVPDTQVSMPYILMGLSAQGRQADDLTAAAIHGIAAKQLADGSWPSYINRAPMENGDIQATAMSVRSLELYGMPGRRDEWERRIDEARMWLRNVAAKRDPQHMTTEDKIMLVSGLAWSGARFDEVEKAANQLLSEQHSDGGWAPLPKLESDAYATAKTLVSLHEAGVLETTDKRYEKAAAYLLRTQKEDGSWQVATRAFPFQPLKDSGFPHGRDQWISAAATSWAAMALTEMLEPAPAPTKASLRIRDQYYVAHSKPAGKQQFPASVPVE